MKHALKVHGTGEQVWGECSCGECFLVTYIVKSEKRATLKDKHAAHVASVNAPVAA